MKYTTFLLFLFLTISSNAQMPTVVLPDGHAGLIQKVLPDQQGSFVYTFETQKCIMWEISTGKQLYTFTPGKIQDIAISPDGKLLVIVSGGHLHLYNTVSGKLVKSSPGYDNFDSAVFSEDGNSICAINDGLHVYTKDLTKSYVIPRNSNFNAKLYRLDQNRVLALGAENIIYSLSTKNATQLQKPAGKFHVQVFLPFQKWIAYYGNDGPTDFYDIETGVKTGSIPPVYKDAKIIPSSTSAEILVEINGIKEGYSGLELLSTQNFKSIAKYFDINSVQYHSVSAGYFDGKKKVGFINSHTQLYTYDFNSKKIRTNFNTYAASLGSDIFAAVQYHPSTGKLHLNTDDINLKTIDLFRMVPMSHRKLSKMPTALAVSATGDTIALFNEKTLTIKNIKKNTIIKPAAPVAEPYIFDRSCYFFNNDGKSFWYGSYENSTFKLMKATIATNSREQILDLKSLTSAMVLGDNSLIAGFNTGYRLNTAGVWELNTGKLLFEKVMRGENSDGQYIAVSTDRKRVLIAHDKKISTYSISGQELTSTPVGFLDKFGSSAANSNLSLFLTGTRSGEVTAYDTSGKIIYQFYAHLSAIRKIFFSPNDELFYTIGYDNTIKAWRTKDGKLLGTLYLFKDSNDYVFMDEDGRFDGTPEGMQKVYYILDRQVIPVERLFERYYTPNLYARVVNGERFDPLPAYIIKPAPKVKISYAAMQRNLEISDDQPVYKNSTGLAEITVTATAVDDKIDEIRLFHNGKIVTLTTRNLIVADDNAANSTTKKYQLNLLPGNNAVRALALNSQRTESEADQITVNYIKTGTVASTGVPTPSVNTTFISKVDKSATLHLIVVGINAYKNTSMSLNYALADATGFKDELEKNAKSVITTVKTYFVKDAEANKAGITNAFSQVQKSAKEQDVFVFYYAGHGVIGNDKMFYLVPTDVSNLKNVQTELVEKGIDSKLLQQYAVDIRAQKQLFILDACQSAGAFENMLSSSGDQQKNIAMVARSTGTHWMAASGSKQFANEFSSLGHGAFTYVLLKALQGEAASNKMITVNGLKNYLQVKVPELMKKYNGSDQYPASYGYGNDFPVEILK